MSAKWGQIRPSQPQTTPTQLEPDRTVTPGPTQAVTANQSSGEDIRYLERGKAHGLNLPGYNFWLFDSRLLARLQFGEHDLFIGVTLDTASSCGVPATGSSAPASRSTRRPEPAS